MVSAGLTGIPESCMSVRNLDRMFRPRSVAVIGASDTPNSVGAALMSNLMRGSFAGPVFPVNPRVQTVHGIAAFASVADLPSPPDLAVIATPPDSVPPLVADLGCRGTRAAVILTAGFGELAAGKERAAQLLQAARPQLLRIVGPNCLGIAVPGIGLNATFAPAAPLAGNIAFLTQSGAMATTVLDWARPRGVGFSAVVSMGDMSDVDFGDLLDYLALDETTHAVLIYAEAVTQARKFMSGARRAARGEPRPSAGPACCGSTKSRSCSMRRRRCRACRNPAAIVSPSSPMAAVPASLPPTG
jgi:acetyltransferase